MKHQKAWIGAGAAVAAAAGAVAVMGAAAADHDSEQPITGDAADRAGAAALEHTGGGTVTGTEIGDEESLYEIEVTLADGTQVDVQLDEDFAVVGDESDGSGED